MTEQAQENEITFSEEQQKFFDKVVGRARIEAREKAQADAKTAADGKAEGAKLETMAAEKKWQDLASHHEARVAELEPYEAEAKVYREMVTGMLKDRVKALGDKAKKAVGALPESMSDVEKLAWLNANEALFGDTHPVVGTPAKKKKLQSVGSKSPEEMGHRPLRL